MRMRDNKRILMKRLVVKELSRDLRVAIKELNKKYLDETVEEDELLKRERAIQKLQKEIEEVELGRKDLRKYYDLPDVSIKFKHDEEYILCEIK